MGKHSLAFAIGLVTAVALFSSASAQQRFKTPEEGADALVAAVRTGDVKTLVTVLGPGGAEIVSSGDPVADAETRKEFLEAYDKKHSVTKAGDNKAVMLLGDGDWPLPIPLVKRNDTWQFDTAAGRNEILARRVGKNEFAAILVCLAYVDAQNEYADSNAADSGVYAQRIISSPGKKDGLYWPTAGGERPSPLGKAVASATKQGYRVGVRAPFHGYYYNMLTRQTRTAPGGVADYIVRGKMIGGFALAAYPAEYGNSGVMTFLVNHDGDVFEKDLGPNTAKVASSMTAYSPDHTWHKVVDTVPPQ